MRRLILILAASAISLGAGAQGSQAEGIKMYNYNKLKTAQASLAALAPTNAMANYYLGLSYLQTGDVATANTTFLKYPEDPANISGPGCKIKKERVGTGKICCRCYHL